MAQDQDQLRAQLDQQRAEISDTIDQIENRVRPGHVMARRTDRVKRRLHDWKDSVFGNDEPDYPSPRAGYRSPTVGQTGGSDRGIVHRVGDAASGATDTVQHAPAAVRRQTQGNPMAAGAIALGAGWLIGSLIPESRSERRAIRRVEPQLSDAATTLKHEGQHLVDDLKEPAKRAAEDVKHSGRDAAHATKDQAAQAGRDMREHTEH